MSTFDYSPDRTMISVASLLAWLDASATLSGDDMRRDDCELWATVDAYAELAARVRAGTGTVRKCPGCGRLVGPDHTHFGRTFH